MKYRIFLIKMGFCDLRVLVRKLAGPFGHPTQVSTQVQLAATGDHLPVRLTRTLNLFRLEGSEERGKGGIAGPTSFEHLQLSKNWKKFQIWRNLVS